MWKSEDDVLRDIASLSDFGSPGDKESYKILYSVGRGLKTKEKRKTPEKFIDSRTGEAISLEDPALENGHTSYQSKGRGSLVGSLFRTKLQLQQQLRLARPLGSGDEAIESYYGRDRSQNNASNSVSLPNFEFADKNSKMTSENHNSSNSKSHETSKRVVATRKSSTQINALITSLLSKRIEDSDATLKQDFLNDITHEQPHSNSINSEKCNKNGNYDNMQNRIASDSDLSDSTFPNNWNKKSFEKNANHRKEGTSRVLKKKYLGNENFKIIDNDESEEEKYLEKKETIDRNVNLEKVENTKELSDSDRGIKYKELGERPNRLRKNCWNTMGSGSCDVTSFFNYTDPTENVIFIDEDFPPLRKS